jgi:RNA polymerase sigma factor (TIGR02999 family)
VESADHLEGKAQRGAALLKTLSIATGDLPGSREAHQYLASLFYDELRKLARQVLNDSANMLTLQPTALVHESLLRLFRSPAPVRDRSHFLAMNVRVMRQVIIDEIRRTRAGKRRHIRVDTVWIEQEAGAAQPAFDLEALDAALDALAVVSPEHAQIIELRFYVGLDMREIAEFLGSSERTIKRRWQAARAWLLAEMTRAP